jgi:hypothetical protein
MHEGGNPRFGKFEFLNLAGGFPAKRTLLVVAIPRCQMTSPILTTKHAKGHERREMLSGPWLLRHQQRGVKCKGLETPRGSVVASLSDAGKRV